MSGAWIVIIIFFICLIVGVTVGFTRNNETKSESETKKITTEKFRNSRKNF
jgi:hypothetical protein